MSSQCSGRSYTQGRLTSGFSISPVLLPVTSSAGKTINICSTAIQRPCCAKAFMDLPRLNAGAVELGYVGDEGQE